MTPSLKFNMVHLKIAPKGIGDSVWKQSFLDSMLDLGSVFVFNIVSAFLNLTQDELRNLGGSSKLLPLMVLDFRYPQLLIAPFPALARLKKLKMDQEKTLETSIWDLGYLIYGTVLSKVAPPKKKKKQAKAETHLFFPTAN